MRKYNVDRMKRTGRGNLYRLVLIVGLLSVRTDAEKQKRQIFREQVLPALGGKIPEEAFKTDRLALNRLNKEGITVPDGVVLDARHVHKHPHHDQVVPEIIKVYLTPDGRYVPPEGRFHYNYPKTVDTTYVIRSPYGRGGRYKSNNNFGVHKVPRIYPKPQSYYRPRIVPLIPPAKPGIYKPIVAPLVIPANEDLLDQSYLPGWNIAYDWDTVYRPFDDYFLNNIAFFNSHQIITDYQGFLNEFHERASRHVATKSGEKNRYQGINDRRHQQKPRINPQVTSYPRPQENRGDSQNPGYPNLTKMPETTNFSCLGRKGTFADIETKCQVFHECSGWSRTSSLCPSGTVYSEAKKRCEWWNTVECGH